MKFIPVRIQDAGFIETACFQDERGFFAPLFEDKTLRKLGISDNFTRLNHSLSVEKGTLRGLHYQEEPMQEAKMIFVLKGSIWDVALDLRSESSTYKKHLGVELNEAQRQWFYIPAGCAHGFQTLEDNCEILYLCSRYYALENERGIRWDDPYFNITWPLIPTVISEKDRDIPDFRP